MTDHAVAIAGAGPTGLMVLASCRWPPTTRSTGREPVVCRPER